LRPRIARRSVRDLGGPTMLTLSSTTRVFVATQPTDLRRGFDSLFGLARDFLKEDPMSGHLFAFRNRAGDRLKILWWDRDGLAMFYKRLEVGSFRFPIPKECDGQPRIEMTADDLQLVLQGIDPSKVKRSKRYRPPTPTTSPTPSPTPSGSPSLESQRT
jgi:transposase